MITFKFYVFGKWLGIINMSVLLLRTAANTYINVLADVYI